jgi:hypothetical protein
VGDYSQKISPENFMSEIRREAIWKRNGAMNNRHAGSEELTMADRTGLRLIGVVVACVTCAVVLVAAMLVHKTIAGELFLDQRPALISSPR